MQSLLVDGHAASEDTFYSLAIDGLAFPACGVTHGARCDAVDVPQSAGGMLVHQTDRVRRKQALFGTGKCKPMGYILRDIFSGGVMERKAMVNTRVQRAIASALELVFQFRQADQDQRQQRSTVPLIVE